MPVIDSVESGDDSLCLDTQMCGILGVGVDLVHVKTLQRLLESDQGAFVDNYWTARETEDAEGIVERLAARWAAKEAVMKALGRGLGDVDPVDVEITRVTTGALRVRLHRSASAAAEGVGAGCVHVSVSHEQGWAIAFAVSTYIGERHRADRTLGNTKEKE
ncbi:MAG: holo-ACP synthase [bacterium]|nr:holo-ACP synthase [bacterium]